MVTPFADHHYRSPNDALRRAEGDTERLVNLNGRCAGVTAEDRTKPLHRVPLETSSAYGGADRTFRIVADARGYVEFERVVRPRWCEGGQRFDDGEIAER